MSCGITKAADQTLEATDPSAYTCRELEETAHGNQLEASGGGSKLFNKPGFLHCH